MTLTAERQLHMVHMVPIDRIKLSGINPASRTSKRALRVLAESICNLDGIVVPLIVRSDYTLLDGHRRLAAAKELGMTEVPCLINDDITYVALNETARKMSTLEWASVARNGGEVPPRIQKQLDRIVEWCGPNMLNVMAEMGMSPNVIKEAAAVATYVSVDPTSKPHMAMILRWLVLGRRSSAVHRAMLDRIPPNTLWKAITQDKDLRANWRSSAAR
jgi:hypothetical protein